MIYIMRAILIFALFAFILLTAQGCTEEIAPVEEKTEECPFPLTIVDNVCCFDGNSNGICDNEEAKEEAKTEQPVKTPEAVVEIMNMKFLPPNITIKKGTTVRWVNRDLFYGNVIKIRRKCPTPH